jgi:photosystem I reaction center subunit XII|uniref:Photosystem I reaction center subunit XII n=1 Tax=Cedrus deodara TaxID=3322 RepID=E1CBJ0_CEDDE|nr:photosystem I protein M [Cedrus deodara]YP_003934179.1 photosystem I protein M [Cedrus deodara]BAJ19520.1 photosystem I protein M [Cedrus deodara]BAJ19562.1 photosystem I protein M [Cedrus deodara]
MITEGQFLIALFVALITSILALRLGKALYE